MGQSVLMKLNSMRQCAQEGDCKGWEHLRAYMVALWHRDDEEGPFPRDTLLRQYELALPADKVNLGLTRSQPGKGLSLCLPNKTVIGNFARRGSESSPTGTDGGFPWHLATSICLWKFQRKLVFLSAWWLSLCKQERWEREYSKDWISAHWLPEKWRYKTRQRRETVMGVLVTSRQVLHHWDTPTPVVSV